MLKKVFVVFLILETVFSSCPPFKSETIELTCELNDKEQDCSKPAEDGSIMTMKCKEHYIESSNATHTTTICTNDTWNRPFLVCVPGCGERIAKGTTFIVRGVNATKGDFPWHVAIYHYVQPEPEYICGGSIITVHTILSAAHCFTASHDGKLYEGIEIYIGAGKYFSGFNDSHDKNFAQIRKVKKIIIPGSYKGILSIYTKDIAILILDKPLELTNFIRPVCLDWDSKFVKQQLKQNTVGEIVGWGYTSVKSQKPSYELKFLEVPYIESDRCTNEVPKAFIKYVTSDKFCAGYSNHSKSVCLGDSGGGLVFPLTVNNRTKYYVQGIVSAGHKAEGSCDINQYGVYTKVSEYLPFIKQVHLAFNITTIINTTLVLTGGCTAPTIENGKLTLSEFEYLPRTKIPNHSILTVECDQNFNLYPPTSRYITCNYGKWDKIIPKCFLCGLKNIDETEMDYGNTTKKILEYPWHTGIYLVHKKRYFFGCGGVIISPSLILTDSKCIPNGRNNSKVTQEFQIAAGKYYSENFEDELFTEKYEQTRNVTLSDVRIINELAIILLKIPFEMNHVVQPVCIDWDSKFETEDLNINNQGRITSWKQIKFRYENELISTKYPYIDILECLRSVPEELFKELIQDKFCTSLSKNDTKLCQANQGSGLVFKNSTSNKYFLRGIAVNILGSKLFCSENELNIFVKISSYLQPILNILNEII